MGYDVQFESLDQVTFFDVRGRISKMQNVLDDLGLRIPEKRNGIASVKYIDVMRAGRDRLMIRTQLENELDVYQNLLALTKSVLVQCTLVSDMYRGVALAGTDSEKILAQLTPLNFSRVKPATVSFTEVFRLAGFIICESDSSYKIYVERSYFDYMLRRLSKCALIEFTP